MTISPQNIQWPEASNFVVGDRGTMALGVKDVQALVPDTIVAAENFETDPITGSGTWTLTGTSPHAGLRCLRSAVIGNSANTQYSFPVPGGGPTSLRFWHRVSSESGFDFFQVYKNTVSGPNLLFQLSGTLNTWQQLTVSLAGVTDIIFQYIKDSSSSSGLDAAFIDDLEWIIPGLPAIQVYEPFHLNNSNEVKVTIGNFPAVAHLNCATDSVEICNDAGAPITVSGTVALDAPTLAALETINVGNIPHVVVDNFPVAANLNCATDSVEICNDAGSPITVSGTVALDAPTLAALETVTVLQGTSPWVVSGTVSIGSITFPYAYPEDSGHVSGNTGAFVLGVRNDVGTSLVNNDLDYAPLQLDSTGALRVTTRKDRRVGMYFGASPNTNLTTAADAATAGRFWLVNTSAIIQVRVVEVRFSVTITSLLDLGGGIPRVQMERMTFTGTPSGTLIPAAKRDSIDPANVGTFRTASTGMVITAGAAIRSWYPAAQTTIGGLLAVNAAALPIVEQIFTPRDESGDIVLRQNEGLVFRQAAAGSATEARTIQIDIVWEEFSV